MPLFLSDYGITDDMHAVAVIIPEEQGPEAFWLANLAVQDGQLVEEGQPMARLEGRRGSLDLLAPQAGYVTGLKAFAGQAAQPGDVLCYLAEKPALAAAHPGVGLGKYLGNAPLDPTGILIYGGGGHGKAVLELLRAARVYRAIGVIDDGLPLGSEILGLPVVGGAASLKEWFNRGVRLATNGVGGIGNVAARLKIFDVLAQEGFSCPCAGASIGGD